MQKSLTQPNNLTSSVPQPTGKRFQSAEPASRSLALEAIVSARAASNTKALPSPVPGAAGASEGRAFVLIPHAPARTIPALPTPPAAPAQRLTTAEQLYKSLFGVLPTIIEAPEAPKEAATFRIDPELGRLAIALHLSAQLRAWMIIRDEVREAAGSGWIERSRLVEALDAQGIHYTERHLRRLLLDTPDHLREKNVSIEGLFWDVTRKRIYMRSWVHVAKGLTSLAQIAQVGRIERNRPGAREMYIPVQGDIEQWEAEVYAAWFAYRNNPVISRAELCVLFGRDKTTLRRWEKTHLQHKLTVVKNFSQCPSYERFYNHIPQHAHTYVAYARHGNRRLKVQRIRWQIPNTYKAGAVKQHYKKGQAAKVRRRVNMVAVTLPADERRGGWPRLYFDKAETLKQFVDKHPDGEPRYVWRGLNTRDAGIWEINQDGFPLTHHAERVPQLTEREFLMIRGWK